MRINESCISSMSPEMCDFKVHTSQTEESLAEPWQESWQSKCSLQPLKRQPLAPRPTCPQAGNTPESVMESKRACFALFTATHQVPDGRDLVPSMGPTPHLLPRGRISAQQQGHLPGQLGWVLHTLASLLCFFDTLWFFGLTDSLCLAALLSRRAMARGMASRLTLSMVPAEEKCLFGRDGLIGATCSGNYTTESVQIRTPCGESWNGSPCWGPAPGLLRGEAAGSLGQREEHCFWH